MKAMVTKYKRKDNEKQGLLSAGLVFGTLSLVTLIAQFLPRA